MGNPGAKIITPIESKALSVAWLRRYPTTMVALLVVCGFWTFANFLGRPEIPRFNQFHPPAGATVYSWVVFGWPIATSQKFKATWVVGADNTDSHEYELGYLFNVLLGIFLALCTLFVCDWRRYRRGDGIEAQLSDVAPSMNGLAKLLLDRKNAFYARWKNILRIFFAVVAISIGALMLWVIGREIIRLKEDIGIHFEVIQFTARSNPTGFGTYQSPPSSSDYVRMGVSLATIAQRVMLCSIVLILGVLLLVKRFRLRVALAAAFLVGIMGYVPFLIASNPLPRGAIVSVGLDKNLSKDQFDCIRQLLQPPVTNSTLPADMQAELGLADDLGIQNIEVFNSAREREGVQFQIEFLPNVDRVKRDTVLHFYVDYFFQLVYRAAKLKKHPGISAGTRHVQVGCSAWSRWKNGWFASQESEMDKLFSENPSP